MSYNFLDKTGLAYFWQKVKAKIPTKTSQLTNDSGFVNSSSNVATATTLQTYLYNRSDATNIWAKIATTTITKQASQWEERHAFLFIKGTHNSNYNQNGIIAIDATGNGQSGKVGSYNAQFMTATKDIDLSNFYIEYLNGDSETDGVVNFWVKIATNRYASWQVKILQNTGWTIKSSTATTTTMPSTGYTGKNAVLSGNSLKATQDSDGNAINTTYYKASNPNGYTSNTGTITGIKMNGASKGTSGVVDLGTVITAHQDISGKVDKVSGKGLSTNDYTTTEKTKLSGIATGAEVNQNAFSNVKVGNTTIQADSKTDTLELVAGNNITLTPNSTNDSVTISATSGGGDNEAQLYNFVCSSVIPGDDNTNDTFVIDVDTDIRPNTFVYDSTATYTNVKLGFDFDLLGQCYGTNGINVRLVKNNTTLKEFNVYKKNGNDIDVNYINRYGTLEHVNTIMFNVAFDCSNSEVTVYGQGLLYYDDIIEPLTLYFDLIYPVGSIYMSVNNTNPATLFGRGTWVQLKDRFLLGAGDTYTAGNTGGEATHQLTKAELPAYDLYNASHSHNISTLAGYNGKQGNAPGVNGGNNQGSNTYTVSATIKVSSGGSNTPHNNMPPYLVVYMWKRTA